MKKGLLALVVLVMISSSVSAGRIWHYNTVSDGIAYEGSALALRNGQVWPTVVANHYSGESHSFTQTPVGWLQGPSTDADYAHYVRAASSDDGRAAFVTPYSVTTIGSEGWSSSGFDLYDNSGFVMDVDFNADNQVSVLRQSSISTFNGITWSESTWNNTQYQGIQGASLAYDSYGQANVVGYAGGYLYYGMQGNLTGGNWLFDVESPIAVNVMPIVDLTLTTNDIPVLAYVDDNYNLTVTSFDIETDRWFSSNISYMNSMESYVISSDSKGGVGLAYIDNNSHLNFSYFDGIGWSSSELIAESGVSGTIGLDFDYEDNPVISFTGYNPEDGGAGLIVAYDPIVADVPEPVIIGMLSLGGLLIARRR